uniref:TLC domain-containing protein n=1 Tax=Hucho hucho TaxID=62062 RepID=A0A4W5QCX7_9TELE
MFMLAWGKKSAFKSWNNADVFVVSERLVSSIHATLATIVGFIIATASSDVMSDRLTKEFVWFGAPYMAFDIYAMYLSNYHSQKVKGHKAYRKHSLLTIKLFLLRHPLLVVHHMVLLTVFMTGVGGDFFIGCFFMAEFSTPFVSLGNVLIQLGLEDSWLHRVNGVMVLLSFLTCRILLFPYMYWVYGQQYIIPFHKVPFHLPLHCNLANLSILAPQIYLFVQLCHKPYRLYLRQTRSKGQLAHKDGSKTD